jgi:predicted transcriptional regulator
MQKYSSLLERLGLSASERDIYLYLLSYPYKIVSDIVRETRYHRPAVYRALRSLEASSLVEKSYLDGKRYYYHATSPANLMGRLESLILSAERLIPELQTLHDKNAEAPILSVKEWVSGIQEIHRDLVTSLPVGGIYYRYSSSKEAYGNRAAYIPPEYFDLQQSKSLERCVISNEKRKADHSNNPNRDIVAIPAGFDLFDDNITKIIYGNKVAVIDYESQIGWTIESERFARYEEKIFRLLHAMLKKMG